MVHLPPGEGQDQPTTRGGTRWRGSRRGWRTRIEVQTTERMAPNGDLFASPLFRQVFEHLPERIDESPRLSNSDPAGRRREVLRVEREQPVAAGLQRCG